MKNRLAAMHLTNRFHGPLRFGSRWRGHELALRICQIVAFILLAVIGGQFVALLIRHVVRSLAAF